MGLEHRATQAPSPPQSEDDERDGELGKSQLHVGGDEVGERLAATTWSRERQHLNVGTPGGCEQRDREQSVIGVAERIVGEGIGSADHDEIAPALPFGDEPRVATTGETADGRRAHPEENGLGGDDVAHVVQSRDVAVPSQVPLHDAEDRRAR